MIDLIGLERWRSLATQGAWGANGSCTIDGVHGSQLTAFLPGGGQVCIVPCGGASYEDLRYIAAMHVALPALIELARATLRMRAALEAIEPG